MGFKKYAWTIGNTTFRESNLNSKIEIQLESLKKLFELYKDNSWSKNLQEKYYDSLSDITFDGKPIVKGTALNKAKDARQLTSALADLGLVQRKTRTLTEVGEQLLYSRKEVIKKNDDFFGIEKDSFIYLKQLLKTQIYHEDIKIRPFIAFLYLVSKHNFLSRDEFTYILPTCLNESDVHFASDIIVKMREGLISIDSIIQSKISKMSNYKEALTLLLETNNVTQNLITSIGFNRKSAVYDKPIYPLYLCLFEMNSTAEYDSYLEKKLKIKKLNSVLEKINVNQQNPWRNYLKVTKKSLTNQLIDLIYNVELLKSSDVFIFKNIFFYTWHTLKWKSTLEDYFDLNRRYFLLSDVIKYGQEQFSLTTLASAFFENIVDELLQASFLEVEKYNNLFYKNVELKQINSVLNINKKNVYESVQIKLGVDPNIIDVDEFLKQKRNQEFNQLIDQKFTDEVLLELMDSFIERNDDKIKQLVTDDATPSTIFEYIIGIIWYIQSGRKGNIEDYLKLSLDANFLPKSHAIGGNADIIFNYAKTNSYPNHDLLLEVTLSEKDSQRQMEWEPVTRHLESQMIKSKNVNDYCVFVGAVLNKKTMQTFRLQKDYEIEKFEEGRIKIIPLDGTDIKQIILKNHDYDYLYEIFKNAFESSKISNAWYEDDIVALL